MRADEVKMGINLSLDKIINNWLGFIKFHIIKL